MNSFEVRARQPHKFICWVGYDRAARSYFVYVASRSYYNERKEMVRNNHVVIWRGTREEEITTIERVRELLEPWAELPNEIATGLLRAWNAEVEKENELRGMSAK
jgi:hypothetical protein